jgi:hypothetical protein
VSERAVRLGHLVSVLATLHSGTQAVRSIENLIRETVGHRVLATSLRVAGQPAERERVRAVRLHLDGHLVGAAADAARADLERGTHVVERLLEHGHGVLAGLLRDVLESTVDDALGETLLAVQQDLVDELADDGRAVDGIGDDGALGSGTFTGHYFTFFAP